MDSGPDVWALTGAVTGVIALFWNIWRSLRQRPRLDLRYFVAEERTPERRGSLAYIGVTNTGVAPAYIVEVSVVEGVPWMYRVPLLRSTPFRLRDRWWSRWVWSRPPPTQHWKVPTDPDLKGKLDAGDAWMGRLVDIVGGQPDPMESEKVNTLLDRWQWAIVATGLRDYAARITDNRLPNER